MNIMNTMNIMNIMKKIQATGNGDFHQIRLFVNYFFYFESVLVIFLLGQDIIGIVGDIIKFDN